MLECTYGVKTPQSKPGGSKGQSNQPIAAVARSGAGGSAADQARRREEDSGGNAPEEGEEVTIMNWIILIPVLCAVVWISAHIASRRSDSIDVKKRMIRVQWAALIVGLTAFMIFEGHNPGRDASTVPIGGSAY